MNTPYRQPIDHPSAWRGADFDSLDEFYFPLREHHVDALDRALRIVQKKALGLDELSPADFQLPEIQDDINDIYHELIHGRGVVILRGLPVERYTLEELEILYWGLGTHFGEGVSQSVMGDRIGHVTDVSGKDPNERAYRNSLAVPSHTDSADIVGMLSIRKAKEGGLSTYTSAVAMHNEILATHPEYLDTLYRGFRSHRFGEQLPGEPPITAEPIPVLSEREGYISARIVPEYIDMAEAELGEKFPPHERAALDYFLALTERDDMRISLMLEPGDISFINNYFVLHSRTAFYDSEAPDDRRYLLRLWLIAKDRRPVQSGFAREEAAGIQAQEGRENSYFGGGAAKQANRGRYGEE